ncbi:MAG: hypothetical protein ABII23_04700 [bacterium]
MMKKRRKWFVPQENRCIYGIGIGNTKGGKQSRIWREGKIAGYAPCG